MKMSLQRRLFLAGGPILVGLFLFSAPAMAKEIYVDGDAPDGGNGTPEAPFNGYNDALPSIVQGEENILYGTGNFNEGVLVDARYAGTSDTARTIITSWPGRSLPVNDVTYGDENGKPVFLAYYVNAAPFVSIRNQIVRGSAVTNIWFQYSPDGEASGNDTSNAPGKGICFYDSPRGKILNNIAYNNGMTGIIIPQVSGNADDILVEGNTVHHNGEAGIQSHGLTNNLVIRNNTTYENNYTLMRNGGGIATDSQTPAQGLLIEGNVIRDEVKGINVSSRNGAVIRANTIERSSEDGVNIRVVENSTIERNTIRYGLKGGIIVDTSSGITLDGNTIMDNATGGITVRVSPTTVIQNSLLVTNGNFGISLFDDDGTTIRNNTIVDHMNGLQIFGGMITKPHLAMSNNVFYDNPTVYFAGPGIDGYFVTSDYNAFAKYRTLLSQGVRTYVQPDLCKGRNWECNSLDKVDPKFVDVENRNFHLLANSPLVSRGDASNATEYDLDGDYRLADGRVDIGADEFRWFPPAPGKFDYTYR